MYVPDNLATKPPKMRDLLEQVASKTKDKWKLMGFTLNLEQGQLNTISPNCTDSILCYTLKYSLHVKRHNQHPSLGQPLLRLLSHQ